MQKEKLQSKVTILSDDEMEERLAEQIQRIEETLMINEEPNEEPAILNQQWKKEKKVK